MMMQYVYSAKEYKEMHDAFLHAVAQLRAAQELSSALNPEVLDRARNALDILTGRRTDKTHGGTD